MPHVDIKCFPRDLSDDQKTALAADIAEVLIRHLNTKDRAVSVALNQVQESDWQRRWWAHRRDMSRRLQRSLSSVRSACPAAGAPGSGCLPPARTSN